MDYKKKFEDCYVFDEVVGCWYLTSKAQYLSSDDWCDLVEYVNSLNQKIIERLHSPLKQISTSDVVLAKNTNRKFDKSTVCLRVTNNLLSDLKKMAGDLNVPATDLMLYVLEYGFASYRVIKEI